MSGDPDNPGDPCRCEHQVLLRPGPGHQDTFRDTGRPGEEGGEGEGCKERDCRAGERAPELGVVVAEVVTGGEGYGG
ncbi:hypothetical protein [Methanoculleus bourgensis]|uniref:hypothetical protein n=1 Tax=Methanoculleus bourgensis TaxID=83986 RepID=UPI001EE257C2|nr:hypothetical protein [Methanoculleus bourgensis]